MSSQSVRPPRGNRKTIIIGFDFGTHSTKVVFRERGRSSGRVAQFDALAKGYPRLASPSLVRYVDGRLFFGTQALQQSGGVLFSSLKVRLLCEGRPNEPSFPAGLNCRTLVAAYCAWAFQQLRPCLKEVAEAGIFLNVSAPMSHCETSNLKTTYLQIVQAAWNVSFAEQPIQINQGISSDVVLSLFASLLNDAVVSPEYRRFEVLPETIAPVVSLSLDPLMKPGIYVIIDAGAGTTEMSVFHAGDPGGDQMVLCYQDETILLGGNDLQSAALLDNSSANVEVNNITAHLAKKYRDIWQRSYLVDAANPLSRDRWKDLTLVLSGGGTRHPRVAARLGGINPVPQWRGYKSSFEVCRHIPGTLEVNAPMREDEGSMFAVANGLAIDRSKWPVIFPPHAIEPLAAPEQDEQKQKVAWWLSEMRPPWV